MDKTREEPGYIMSKERQEEVMESIETLKETPLSNETVDKVRKEFEKTISGFYVKKCVENGTMEQAFYDNQFGVFKDGRQSRDKEIHRLDQIATENSDWFDALKIDFDKQAKEIRALREKNEYLKDVLKIIAKYQYQTASKGALLLSGWAEQALENVDA